MHFVLASGSPRRRELLEMLGVQNLRILPAKGEEQAPEGAGPGELVTALARAKVREAAARCDAEDVIVGADTIVWLDDRPFGKPGSEEEARRMLRTLSGREHRVYTGVCVRKDGRELCEWEESRVFFRDLTEKEICAYVATGEPMDKAGAYGIQNLGSMLVESLRGDYFTVMGLPVCRLAQALKRFGLDPLLGQEKKP